MEPKPFDISQSDAISSSLSPNLVEREHVHQVYDNIASHFSHTRHHAWPIVTEFLQQLTAGSIVADIGCGNGKYLHVNDSISVIGSDRSLPLLKCAAVKENNCSDLFACDALKIPMRSESCDAAICIAVLHHVSNNHRRIALISELARIVKSGRSILILAWAFEQDERSKRIFNKQDVLVDWKLQHKYAKENAHSEEKVEVKESQLSTEDEKKWIVYQRYCHVYREGEIESLVAQIPGLIVEKTCYSRSNWCVFVRRL